MKHCADKHLENKMKKYALLLGVSYLGSAIAAEPVNTDKSSVKSGQKKKVQNRQRSRCFRLMTIKAQKANIDHRSAPISTLPKLLWPEPLPATPPKCLKVRPA